MLGMISEYREIRIPSLKNQAASDVCFDTNEASRWNWQKSSCQAAGVLLLMHVSARKSKTAHKGHGEKALDADGLWVWSFCVTMCLCCLSRYKFWVQNEVQHTQLMYMINHWNHFHLYNLIWWCIFAWFFIHLVIPDLKSYNAGCGPKP